MNSFLSSRYPIICAAMNHVSDLTLIRAAAAAGITPGFVLGQITDSELEGYLQDYHDTSVILTLPITQLLDDLDRYVIMGVKYIEILRYYDLNHHNESAISDSIKRLQQQGVKIILRGNLETANPRLPFDAYVIKGSEGAGGSKNDVRLLADAYDHYKNQLPHVIPTGGIHCSDQVKYYLDRGAPAVAIGTLFALSQESKLSSITKVSMIESDSQDLVRIGRHGKQAMVFQTINGDDENNHTMGLQRGVNDIRQGHVYCGTAIGHIKLVKPMQDIVSDLVQLL